MDYTKRYCSDLVICPKFEEDECKSGKEVNCEYYQMRHNTYKLWGDEYE